ncbi:MAG: dethiobiotin synthase [Betaproteobacteria bacterium]|nr:dethiobiotin synthase [Betaproteobacteria bacterium]
MTASGYFVTGTDTGVGKTLVACALLHAFARMGKRVVGMKPVAAGAVRDAEGWLNDDVAQLCAAGNVKFDRALVNPYCFEAAIAPHIAARLAGVTIDLASVVVAYTRLAATADVVIVEGAGGFCVPLNRTVDSADLAQRLCLPVILVVGVRLGCLNHAILTAAAVRARGLKLAGWIANRIDAAMPVADENIAALGERLDSPLLGTVEFSPAPDAHRLSSQLNLAALR